MYIFLKKISNLIIKVDQTQIILKYENVCFKDIFFKYVYIIFLIDILKYKVPEYICNKHNCLVTTDNLLQRGNCFMIYATVQLNES